MVVMRRIVDESWAVRYPPYVSPLAKDLLSRLLQRQPARRIGCGPLGALEVKRPPLVLQGREDQRLGLAGREEDAAAEAARGPRTRPRGSGSWRRATGGARRRRGRRRRRLRGRMEEVEVERRRGRDQGRKRRKRRLPGSKPAGGGRHRRHLCRVLRERGL